MYSKLCPQCGNSYSFIDNHFQCPSCHHDKLINVNPLIIPSLKFLTKLKGVILNDFFTDNEGIPVIKVYLDITEFQNNDKLKNNKREHIPYIPYILTILQGLLPSPWYIKDYFLEEATLDIFCETLIKNIKKSFATYTPQILPNCSSNTFNNYPFFFITVCPEVLDKNSHSINEETPSIFNENCMNVYRSYNTLFSYIINLKNYKIDFDYNKFVILVEEYKRNVEIWRNYRDKIVRETNKSIDSFITSDFRKIAGDTNLNDFDEDNSDVFQELVKFKKDYVELHKNYNILSCLNKLASQVNEFYMADIQIQHEKKRNFTSEFPAICDAMGDCDYCPFLGQFYSEGSDTDNVSNEDNFNSCTICSNPLNQNINWDEFFESKKN